MTKTNTKSIGFFIPELTNSAMCDGLLQTVSIVIDNNPRDNICVFTSFFDKVTTYNVPILHLNHAKFFDGNMWIFDLASIIITKNFPKLQKRILYAGNMPWIQNKNSYYREWQSIYDDGLDFIVSNAYLYDIYSICWKKPLGVMESLDYEKVQKFI